MKETMTFCLMVCGLFFGMVAFANDTAPPAGQRIDGKFYVEPGTIHVAPNGIFLNIDGNFVPVNAVCVDEYGVYVLGYEVVNVIICPKCDTKFNADNQSIKCPHGWLVQYPVS